MPLTPATTDKLLKVGLPGTATTLAAPGYTNGVTTAINVGATTNWPTDTPTIFAMDAVTVTNGVATRTPGTYGEFFGIVTSSTTIGSLLLRYGTPQNYVAGSLTRVYIPVAGTRENDLIDAIRQDHNGKGNHQTLTDDNGNAWLTRAQVASAVDSVQVTNAITGGSPRLDAVGTDSTIPLYLGGKGGEPAHVENPEVFNANFVASGGVVAISAGLITTFSNIVYYIAGKRYKKSGVANRTWGTTKDGYVDIDITGTVTYTEVANGAASPALAANSIRLAIVVTGASVSTIQQSGYDTLGNRISLTSPVQPKHPNMWYEELGRVTATATGTTLSVNVPNRKYIKIIANVQAAGAVASLGIRFNADASSSNYSYRVSDNGGADATGAFAGIPLDTGTVSDITQTYGEVDVLNISGQEKIAFGHSVNGGVNTGVANPPKRRETQGKWITTGAITSVQVVATTSIIAAGSELIILGHD